MHQIAVLLTCFNRKEKTLKALKNLYSAYDIIKISIGITIYLTDDGSTDGTGDAVSEKFPEVNILQGNGELYWAGGMRNSWNEALKKGYDGYLLLNDDTMVFSELFESLLDTHGRCVKQYGCAGIYIGSTRDGKTQKLTYGGSVFTNRFMAHSKRLEPNDNLQECELGNANIMLVSKYVVDRIGILSGAYIHGLADYDYTLMAVRKKIPVLIAPDFLGECTNDNKNPYSTFHTLTIAQRIKVLYNPLGLDFRSNLQFMKRNFIYRLPLVFLAGWLKVLFPKIYLKRLGAINK